MLSIRSRITPIIVNFLKMKANMNAKVLQFDNKE